MPTWGGILNELRQTQEQNPGVPPFDAVRRRYLTRLQQHTGRNAILFASKWTTAGSDPNLISIGPEDMHGFMEVVHALNGPNLDLILHLPGGSAESTEAIVLYLRSKFPDIRVFVPHAAMSAATMLACASNRIVMGKHSFIGPIDPQFIIRTELGVASVPAYAIREQFQRAQTACRDNPALLGTWLPILRQYGPALLVQCEIAQELSQSLVTAWLRQYMFAGQADAQVRAERISAGLANHPDHLSHGRFIPRDRARQLGLVVEDLETDQQLQDLVLSIFHATTHTFNATACVKLIENHLGRAFVRQVQQQFVIPMPGPPPIPMPGPPAGPGNA